MQEAKESFVRPGETVPAFLRVRESISFVNLKPRKPYGEQTTKRESMKFNTHNCGLVDVIGSLTDVSSKLPSETHKALLMLRIPVKLYEFH